MPTFQIRLPHALCRRETVRRIEGMIDQMKRRYGDRFDRLESAWDGHDLKFRLVRGSTAVSGRVAIGARTLTMTVTLPWTLTPFALRLRQQFEQEGRRLLGG